jgi:hypothetical protein
MIDRVDIDALLIGALYGELTPADEARLTAHLVSHPADRAALADLTQTRATFRDSCILSVQFEPPQSVSALLLQEAARRAPRVVREPSEGWFQRFMRSFLAHPAMAAATMLVLVAGVAGTLYMRHGDVFSDPQAQPAVSASEVELAGRGPADVRPTGTGAAPTAGNTPSGSDAYRVRLDEAEAQGNKQAAAMPKNEKQNVRQNDKQEVARNDLAAPAAAKDTRPVVVDGDRKEQAPREAEPALREPATPAKIVSKFAKKPSGIELRSAELMPKDLDDNRDGISRDLGRARGDAVASANEHAGVSGANAPAGGGAATAPGMLAQPRPVAPPAAPAPSAEPSVAVASAPPSGKAKASVAAAKPAPPASVALERAPSQAPQAEPRVAADQAGGTADTATVGRDNRRLAGKGALSSDSKAAKVDDKPAEDKALLGWAQKQRDQVIAFVRSNNCRAAANTATEIYNRAPEYYAANVATARSVKPCLAYLNSEREREDRSRASEREERSKAASKRALSTDTPAAAPAPPPARK